MNSTADRVIAYLEHYDLKLRGTQGRCNSPLRPGSNSHAFSITLDTSAPGGGVWYDFVDDRGGDFDDLYAALLGALPATPATPVPQASKRTYRNLVEYAADHGPLEAFTAAGWQDATWHGRPAIKFPTPGGPRFRLLDDGGDKYIQGKGYRACLYGLERATELAAATGLPLVPVNGEASTVVAQYYGVPAFCQNMGEKKFTTENLASLQAAYPAGPLIIAFDSDATGRRAAPELRAQFRATGYDVRAVDLNGGDHFDVADFARLHMHDTAAALLALQNLPELEPTGHDGKHLVAEIERLRQALGTHQQTIAEQQQEIDTLKARQRWQNDLIHNRQLSPSDKVIMLATNAEFTHQAPKASTPEAPRPVVIAAMAERTGLSDDTVGKCYKKYDGIAWTRHESKFRDAATGQPRTTVQLVPLPALERPLELQPAAPRNHGGKRFRCADCGSENLLRETRVVCAECGCQQGETHHAPINAPEEQLAPADSPPSAAAVPQDAALKIRYREHSSCTHIPTAPQVAAQQQPADSPPTAAAVLARLKQAAAARQAVPSSRLPARGRGQPSRQEARAEATTGGGPR